MALASVLAHRLDESRVRGEHVVAGEWWCLVGHLVRCHIPSITSRLGQCLHGGARRRSTEMGYGTRRPRTRVAWRSAQDRLAICAEFWCHSVTECDWSPVTNAEG